MTVHDFVASFKHGEMKRIPSNCTAHDLIYYAKTRFGFGLKQIGNSLKRVCPTCGK